MILATQNDIVYPHIDWKCTVCGIRYNSTGLPDDNRCVNGHSTKWKPNDDKMEDYIEVLDDLEKGDGVVVAGHGPAPLMGPVEECGDEYIVTGAIDSPRRKIRWDEDDLTIEFTRPDDDYSIYSDVYHIDTVEIKL